MFTLYWKSTRQEQVFQFLTLNPKKYNDFTSYVALISKLSLVDSSWGVGLGESLL